MTHKLPPLPYEMDALEPYITAETLEYHYGKHHKTYVDKLNGLVENTPLASKTLVELIQQETGGVFNNAAQIWNHTFYWSCMTPEKNVQPSEELLNAINSAFGSLDQMLLELKTHALNNFGSGWTWLVKDRENKLSILNTSNADLPIRESIYTALLVCDVWEHAYYVDTRNNRGLYLDNFMKIINWQFVSENFEKS